MKILATSLISSVLLVSTVYAETKIEAGGRVRSANTDIGRNSADAATIKLRFSAMHSFNDEYSVLFQLDQVESFLEDKHSTVLLSNDNPRMQDTPGTDLNQLFFKAQYESYQIKLGRQKVKLASERFVGDIDFWQNDQTFDALSIKTSLFSASNVQYIYANNVNRIFGDDADSTLDPNDIRFTPLNGIRPAAQLGDHEIDGNFLHVELKEWDYVELSGYYYALHNADLPAASNRTAGVSGQFRYKPSILKYTGSVEFAQQRQQQSGSQKWIPYHLIELGVGWRQFDALLRWEVLHDRGGNRFITPLASLHDFQGWADLFTITPVGGVDDRSVRLNWKKRPFQVDVRYHSFRSEKGSVRFGDEVDVDLIYQPTRKHEFKVRFAQFEPDSNQSLFADSVKSLFVSYSYNL